ncbi:MAG TPA: molybdate ABC transporter permease subunit [Nitrospira sp.]|nr:molybdate ABC transporter permease subunit [Nitrospira sp.]
MRHRESTLWAVLALPALALIVMPLAALTSRSTTADLVAVLSRAETQQAILLSLRTTLLAILFVTILGLPLARFIAGSKNRLSRIVDVISDLPIVLPPAAAGIALLAAFGRQGWPGEILDNWGLQITFTSTAVVIAQIFVALPYFVRSTVEGLRRVDPDTLSAAAVDGASLFQLVSLIQLPQCRSAILAGILLGWARAVGEFGATLMFAGNFVGRTQTMPLAVYAGFETDLDIAISLSVILLALSILTLALARWVVSSALEI